jgi:S1-C subfamily serine protease
LISPLVNISVIANQSDRLEDADAQIASLENDLSNAASQISSLQSSVSQLSGLADDVSAIQLALNNQGSGTTGPADSTIADAVAKVKSSVVAINTTYTYSLWGRYVYSEEGAGSGWIINDSGIIVTNYHVIEDADSISVTLDDGRVFDVDLSTVFFDADNDIAIFKIDADDLTPATVGNSSSLRLGDWVVTLGNSLDMGISAKEGIISQLNVSIDVEGQTLSGLIETSAAINAGNSGGILIDMSGEVLGITNAKVSSVGVEGMGYAININDAMTVINELMAEMAAAAV